MQLMPPVRPTLLARVVSVCIVAVCGFSTNASPPNFDWYQRALERFDRLDISGKAWSAAYEFESDPSRGPSTLARATVNKLRPLITIVQAGVDTPMNGADTGAVRIEPSPIAALRDFARVMRLDYLMRLHDGESREAIRCVKTWYSMSAYAGANHDLPSALMATFLFSFGDAQANVALHHGLIGPSEAKELLKEIERGPASDPFGIQMAIARERDATTTAAMREYADADGVARFKHDYREKFEAAGKAQVLAGLTPETLVAELLRADEAFRAALEVFGETDPAKASAMALMLQEEN